MTFISMGRGGGACLNCGGVNFHLLQGDGLHQSVFNVLQTSSIDVKNQWPYIKIIRRDVSDGNLRLPLVQYSNFGGGIPLKFQKDWQVTQTGEARPKCLWTLIIHDLCRVTMWGGGEEKGEGVRPDEWR